VQLPVDPGGQITPPGETDVYLHPDTVTLAHRKCAALDLLLGR
jgi:hypothetical protein